MRYYSTRDRTRAVNFKTAALSGLAPDGGLFVPEELPRLSATVLSSLRSMDFVDIAYELVKPFTSPELSPSVLADIIHDAYPFSAPLVDVGERRVLELFHGPTAAFKDFGARFMARVFSYLRRGDSLPLRVLVATSGDTGGAVADGFFGVPGISVTVLYPKGRVSPLQERQIAGLGENIEALAVEGSFDDCQRLVKAAFVDPELKAKLDLSSANSINICRLIPQAIYYMAAAGKALNESAKKEAPIFCVPSGNFGNLTAGLYAMKMGAPIKGFIAATNINKTIPDYLKSGQYAPRDSVATISNAMDVGAPSNFERMTAFWNYEELRELLIGAFVDDSETKACISAVHETTGYVLDPHGAVGWKAMDKLEEAGITLGARPINLATAHPAKFAETVEPLVGPIAPPETLRAAMTRTVHSEVIAADPAALRSILIG